MPEANQKDEPNALIPGVGKRVFDDLYVHVQWLCGLPSEIQERVARGCQWLGGNQEFVPNVVKVSLRSERLSLLCYPTFEDEPFPVLQASWTFATGPSAAPVLRLYTDSINPPILHRKELLVGESHPGRAEWQQLTTAAEQLGLFDHTATIGFRENWRRALTARGLEIVGNEIRPLGNRVDDSEQTERPDSNGVSRHLTALSRTALSTPVQLLIRHAQLTPTDTFFDYGCGKGDDLAALAEGKFDALGWDPHFRPQSPLRTSDTVNLGFVLNVIEDAAERVEALHKAFSLARKVLSVGVMLPPSQVNGVPFRDGFLTSRGTFQKYFRQEELKEFVESVVNRTAFTVGPGIVFVFADMDAEQRFALGRHRTPGLAARLVALRPPRERKPKEPRIRVRPPARPSRVEALFGQHESVLTQMWAQALELGRWPENGELSANEGGDSGSLSPSRCRRLIATRHDLELLHQAAQVRRDDILVYLASQQFAKRSPYRKLDERLQRDIRAFFGDYSKANREAVALLVRCADPTEILTSCQEAAARGIGFLDQEHSLQLHLELVPRLPSLLRVYVACARVMWDPGEQAQLVKIHIGSGKVSFLEFLDFDADPVPSLKRRIKVDLRKLRCHLFEYGSPQYPMPLLVQKSRYMHEDMPAFAAQEFFDQRLLACFPHEWDPSTTRAELDAALERLRLEIRGIDLAPSSALPDLDQRCGDNFKYRDFIECGETYTRLRLDNVPRNPKTFNALFDLATKILDPVIDYFGGIRLTYGFCSDALSKKIPARIAPKLDQHASCECDVRGRPISPRLGAACDFIVDDEDMFEVARWIIQNLDFDRLYVYGKDRPLHVSYGPEMSRASYLMTPTKTGRLMPRPFEGTARAEPP